MMACTMQHVVTCLGNFQEAEAIDSLCAVSQPIVKSKLVHSVLQSAAEYIWSMASIP